MFCGAQRLGVEPGFSASELEMPGLGSPFCELGQEPVPGGAVLTLPFFSRLTQNELDDEVAESLAEMLKVNQTLKHLW